MPDLSAKALDADPAGMAFLAAVLRPAAPARHPSPLAFKPGLPSKPRPVAGPACAEDRRPGRAPACPPVLAELE